MTQEEIIEGNKLIAFSVFSEDDIRDWVNDIGKPSDKFCLTTLKYHFSWDWLMPVVEKIENMGFWFNIKKNHVTIAWDNKGNHDSNMIHSEFGDFTKIERVWSCIVAFIKYHNERNK